MATFPRLPVVAGDTDEDLSIHLQSHVGPARPLPQRRKPLSTKDEEILRILNEEEDEEDIEEELNKKFEEFEKNESIQPEEEEENNYSDGSTEVEFEKNKGMPDADVNDSEYYTTRFETRLGGQNNDNRPQRRTERPGRGNNSLIEQFKKAKENHNEGNTRYNQYAFFALISFVITCLILFFMKRDVLFFAPTTHKLVENYYEVNKMFSALNNRVDTISKVLEELTSKDDVHGNNQVLHQVDSKLKEFNDIVESRLSTYMEQYSKLSNGFDNLKNATLWNEMVTGWEAKIEEITEKLERVSQTHHEVEKTKALSLDDLQELLPELVPIYIKNNRTYYLPDFNRVITFFIDQYHKEKKLSLPGLPGNWNEFLQENEKELKNYVKQYVQNMNVGVDNQYRIEELVQQKIANNSQKLQEKFNNLVDSLTLFNNQSNTVHREVTSSEDNILLNDLFEMFSKGSVRVNYADYRLGSRVLGFLVSTSLSKQKSLKSLSRRLLLGWFDYLNLSGIKSPKYWKFNANNALIDGGDYWHCESEECSIGIRLSSPVILNDIVIKNPPSESIRPIIFVALYVKPSSSHHLEELIKYLEELKFDIRGRRESRYLKNFVKIKETHVNSGNSIHHIKLPNSLINLRIPVRDIYVEISSQEGTTGLYNIKAYGISEYDLYAYSKELDAFFTTKNRPLSSNDQPLENNDYILGNDFEI